MNNLPVEIEFSSERLKRHLQENPHDATRLAIAHFEDHSVLAIKFNNLKMKLHNLETENIKLRSANTHQSVTLPSFSNRGIS